MKCRKNNAVLLFSGFGKSRDWKEYPSQTKPNNFRGGFENLHTVRQRKI